MLLEDFNQVSSSQLRTLNDILVKDYGVSLSFDSSLSDLHLLECKILADNDQIKLRDSLLHRNMDFSKNLLILESVRIMIREKEENIPYDSVYADVLGTLVEFVTESIVADGKVDIYGAIEVYKEAGYDGYDVNEIQMVLESFFDDEDVIAEDPRRWGAEEETQAAAEEAYRRKYGGESINKNRWEDEPDEPGEERKSIPAPWGGRLHLPGPQERSLKRTVRPSKRALSYGKHKPGMLDKFRKVLGMRQK